MLYFLCDLNPGKRLMSLWGRLELARKRLPAGVVLVKCEIYTAIRA